MASSYSTDLKLELMVTGENSGTWGDITNTNLNLLQQAISGYQEVSIAGGAQTTTLVMSNAALSNARNAVIKLIGAITGNQIVTVPDGIEKTYIVENGTTGAFTVQFKTVSGTGPTFSTTDKGIKIVYSDGTNVVDVNANLSGPTLASDLNVNGKSIISTSNGNITLAPNGTGDVYLDADTVRVGDSGAAATLTTNGAGDLTINTNSGTNSGSVVLSQGTNGNISITPNGTGSVVLDGLNWPQADGTNGQVLQTNGSGQLSFATASGGATQLVSSIPLASGVSVTAGKITSINSSGQIPALPTLNTYGTTRANSSTTAYDYISTDGSRALKVTIVSTGSGAYTITWSGVAISNTATPTNGTVNVTSNFSASGVGAADQQNVYSTVKAISDSQFVIVLIRNAYVGSCSNTGKYDVKQFTITVDSSGNCTKGTENTTGSTGLGASVGQNLTSFRLSKISSNIYTLYYASPTYTTSYYILTVSGTTVTVTSSANSLNFAGNEYSMQLTTNNILGYGFNGTWRTATYTSTPSIGTYTDTTAISDYFSNASWYTMRNIATANADYVLVFYTNTSSVSAYKTFSINQTTGALTLVETGVAATAFPSINLTYNIAFKSNTSFVYNTNSQSTGGIVSVSFSSGTFVGYNNAGYSPVGTPFYNSGDLYFIFYTDASSYPNNIGYTVNAYSTTKTNYLGVIKTTTSTSPVSIVTDGVATGFTSLTAGTLYYATLPFDGTVTTSTSSNILIGKATSTTEILMQRSNTQ
jgi:hypothetical protein